MEIWRQTASWRVVFDWLQTPINRMTAHAERNDAITDEQRGGLRTEVEFLRGVATQLKTLGRGLEDADNDGLQRARDEAVVTDFLCDEAQRETWAILGIRQNILASAGTTREAVVGTSIGKITQASRPRTVEHAMSTARELRSLPEFSDRDGLADRLERCAGVHEEAIGRVDAEQRRIETEFRSQIGTLVNQLRVDIVKVHGRMLATFPRDFVESLFPRSQRRRRAGNTTEPTE